jgi:DNA-directed RNA polymerase II subunit RPB2
MTHVLHYPQKPLVRTKLAQYTNSDSLPSGINAVVAIMTYSGFNQEDSIMINQSAVDRGLFTSSYFKSYRDMCSKNHSTGEEEVFTKPIIDNDGRAKPYSYDKLGPDGFVPKNTFVDANDVCVGKVMPHKQNGVVTQHDTSSQLKGSDEGYIEQNYQSINGDGYKFCKIKIRQYRKPVIGDKLASKCAQKGTIGMMYHQKDMPFSKNGITPDIIMNPHAIPSRMTIGQLMECIMGKAACHLGTYGDATPFTDCSVESIAAVLAKSGYERYGNEILYDGRTGQQLQTEIFIGPTYYQRLKHMVNDKCHSRGSSGPLVSLTRQPAEGRARNGGLRFGEMERDAIVAHGASTFLKERMIDVSDNYRIFVCNKCGLICTANPERKIFKCNSCKNNAEISQVRIPYAMKLLMQELMSMSVAPRIIV